MPPAIAAAGIAAGGSILGGVLSSSATKSAAKGAANTAQQQIAQQNQVRAENTALNQPAIDRGNAAGNLYGNFVGLNGGTAAADALGTFRGSTGYQDLLNTGLGAVNSNAYARGLGASGATLKALQAKGSAIADQSSQQWLGNVGNLINTGTQAAGNVAGINQATASANAGYSQNASDAAGNAALANGSNWSNVLQGLGTIGASAVNPLSSSYMPSIGTQAGQMNNNSIAQIQALLARGG